MGRVLQFPGVEQPARLPEEVLDDLPRQLIVEYPATISVAYDLRTGQVTQVRVDSMPDRVSVFDRESWHELPLEDSSVRTFLDHFDPRAVLAQVPDAPVINWLLPEETPS